LLQSSYASIGGLKGSGFKSVEDMVNNIKLWKLAKDNGKIVAGILYKDKHNIRKTVAIFTDGTKKGKEKFKNMIKDDFERASIEVSHDLLKYIQRNLTSLVKKYAIPSDKVSNILGKDIKIIDKYRYERDINGTKIIKMMLGTQKEFI